MRTFDFAPYQRSTVGFDRLFEMLDSTTATRSDWPPYNIEKRSEDQYRITMAVAGFGQNEIELTQKGSALLIAGQKQAEQGETQFLHQGVAFRSFQQTFSLADYVKVASARLENGLLTIELVREVPEQMKPRRIEIETKAGSSVGGAKQIRQDNAQKNAA